MEHRLTPGGRAEEAPSDDDDFQAALNEHLDLCWNCNSAALCLQRRTLIRPVWFCEQFDSHVPVESRPSSAPAVRQETASSRPPDMESPAKGLCVNCEKRHECVHVMRGETIWFCEEYA